MLNLPLPLKFALKELKSGISGFKIFIVCIALGVASIAGVSSINNSIRYAVNQDAQKLLGGDIQGRKTYNPITQKEEEVFESYGQVSRQIVMRSMAKNMNDDNEFLQTSLIDLKAVDNLYPIYGDVDVYDTQYTYQLLGLKNNKWGAIVDRSLKSRLSLSLDDEIKIGDINFQVRGFIEKEPDRTLNLFTASSRVIISQEAIYLTQLIQPGSLITYVYNIGLYKNYLAQKVELELKDLLPNMRFKIASEANNTLKLFFDNILIYLTLLSLSIILISGVGVANSSKTYLLDRLKTIAILKSFGCEKNFIFWVYFLQFSILTIFGIMLGILMGALVPFLVQFMLESILPFKTVFGLDFIFLAKISLLVLMISLMFFILPLLQANNITTAQLFRPKNNFDVFKGLKKYISVFIILSIIIFFLILFVTEKLLLTLYFIVGVLFVFIFFYCISRFFIYFVKVSSGKLNNSLSSMPITRMAISNLWRPYNITTQIVLSLGLALTVVVCILQIELNISSQISNNIPKNAPDMFFIDLQSHQREIFLDIINDNNNISNFKIAKIIRGRIVEVNGTPASSLNPSKDIEWIFRGERGISQSNDIPEGTQIIEGKWWDTNHSGDNLVSVDQRVMDGLNLAVGDTIGVNILGRKIIGIISNSRNVEWESGGMNFTLIFSPNSLEGIPGSLMGTIGLASSSGLNIEREIVSRLPNVTIIQVGKVVDVIKEVLGKLLVAVRVPLIIAVLAGVLVLISAIMAGNMRKLYEAVLLKVLGAKRSQILLLFFLEYSLLGLVVGFISFFVGNICSFLFLKFIMSIEPVFFAFNNFTIILFTVCIIIFVGLIGMWNALGVRSNIFLRNE